MAPLGENDLKANAHISQHAGEKISNKAYNVLRNVETMSKFLMKNGYTEDTVSKMNRNDLEYACKVKLGIGVQ